MREFVGLEALLELGATRVEIRGDSELVVKQITKEYKCIKDNLITYFVIVNRCCTPKFALALFPKKSRLQIFPDFSNWLKNRTNGLFLDSQSKLGFFTDFQNSELSHTVGLGFG